MNRLKIAIIFGGSSEEHPVSVKSALEVERHLNLNKYEPFFIGITKGGVWNLCDGPGADLESEGSRPAVLSPDRGTHGLLIVGPRRCQTLRLDVVLSLLHGKFGEDGTIQGLLELSGVPYVGCDIQSSALCMDKSLTYLIARDAGIATPRFWTATATEGIDPDRFPYPVFVKPARSGSSFGVSRVARPGELANAVQVASQYDSKVLIEQAVRGAEVGCAVLGDEALTVGELDRIAMSHGFFRIHQESAPERGSENATFIVPADIPDDARARVQETAKSLYRVLGCRGLARVDTFVQEDGTVVLNEVNTLPGLTSYSRYPRMMAAAGLTLADVIDRVVTLAMEPR